MARSLLSALGIRRRRGGLFNMLFGKSKQAKAYDAKMKAREKRKWKSKGG